MNGGGEGRHGLVGQHGAEAMVWCAVSSSTSLAESPGVSFSTGVSASVLPSSSAFAAFLSAGAMRPRVI